MTERSAANKPMIVLTGPTAVGKTGLSIALAKAVGGEIVSADSMQVYKHMDIGSAKITTEEMQGIPHHMIDILEPEDPFNVVIFKEYCEGCIREIYERKKIPILVGGTGFYIQAILKDVDFSKEEGETSDYRAYLERLRDSQGVAYLHDMLKKVDPVSAEKIHENNSKRVIRALEYYHFNEKPISVHNAEEGEKESIYQTCYFVLNDKRELLYSRIDKRVDEMLERGLVEEVRTLKERGCKRGMVSMQGLGYKEILDYLDGEISLEKAVEIIKRDTRHFAKRQITWFKREKDVIWVNKDEFDYQEDRILEYMFAKLRERNLIEEWNS